MTIRDRAIASFQLLPKSFLPEVRNFIDFILLAQ